MFKELYKSYLECSKNKSNTINALNFTIQKEKNLIQLKYELENKIYTPWKSIYFIVTYPKVREVFASDFRDRIIHHFFIRAIERNFYKELSNNTYSCLKNRWTHKCIKDVKTIYWEYKYYLQVDIRSFFMSIDKNILKNIVKKYLPQDKIEHINNKDIDYNLDIYDYLLDVILDCTPTDNCEYKWEKSLIQLLPKEKSLFNCKSQIGMPIGNYTSQFFANIYLNNLDKYIVNDLKIKHYFRYVDDLVIFWNDFKYLKSLEDFIDIYLKDNLNMKLAKNKTKLSQTMHWLDFLWYYIKPYSTYTRNRVKHVFIEKIKYLEKKVIKYYDFFQIKFKMVDFYSSNTTKLFSTLWSYIWHFKHANTKHLFKRVVEKYSYLKYFIDQNGKKYNYLKFKRFKNHYLWYKYFENLYKNTIIFYPIWNNYIFTKKYLYLLNLGLKNILNI